MVNAEYHMYTLDSRRTRHTVPNHFTFLLRLTIHSIFHLLHKYLEHPINYVNPSPTDEYQYQYDNNQWKTKGKVNREEKGKRNGETGVTGMVGVRVTA
jgi:hypothetical protein